MKTIYAVDYKSRSGQSHSEKTEYYEDKLDAYKEADLHESGEKVAGSANRNEVSVLSLWEPGEANPVNRMKLAALEKLSPEEREALGIGYTPSFPTVSSEVEKPVL